MSCRARLRVLLAVLVPLLAVGCGGGGDSDNEGDAKKADGETAEKRTAPPGLDLPLDGPIVLADEEGRLSVVEPGGSQRVAIEGPVVDTDARGVGVRAPGIAFFQTEEGELLMVNALARTAKVIGNLEEAGGDLYNRHHGGGRRFVAFTNQSGVKGLVVDIEAGVSRPLSEFMPAAEDDTAVGEVRISANEQFLFVTADREIRLVPLGGGLVAAGAVRVLPGDLAYFNADGTAIFTAESVPKPAPDEGSWDRVRRIPLDGSAEEVLAERADALHGAAGDAALTREGDVYTLSSHPGDGRKIDFGLTVGEIAFIGQHPIDGTGVTAISDEDNKRRRFALMDPKAASVKHLDALGGFALAAERTGRFMVFSNIRLPDVSGGGESAGDEEEGSTTTTRPFGKGDYAVIDLVSGEVRTTPFDLDTHQQNVQVSPSPDGTRLAVYHANENGEPLTSIISLDDGKATDLDAGFSGWSPSGSAFLAGRIDEARKALRLFIVDDGREREIAVGTREVVWTAR